MRRAHEKCPVRALSSMRGSVRWKNNTDILITNCESDECILLAWISTYRTEGIFFKPPKAKIQLPVIEMQAHDVLLANNSNTMHESIEELNRHPGSSQISRFEICHSTTCMHNLQIGNE